MEKFVLKHGLKPGDRIVTPRSGWRLIQHHAIYWGIDVHGVHWIIENKDGIGVIFITLENFLTGCIEIKRIEYFKGNEYERRLAIQRAESKLGQVYDLWDFNCENFANYVQYGKSFSTQVNNIKGGLKVAAGFAGVVLFIGAITRGK
jgi:hypothetical protein